VRGGDGRVGAKKWCEGGVYKKSGAVADVDFLVVLLARKGAATEAKAR
jgi:hypothetical protein